MDIFDQILENLELERELGTRTVEMDRALLVPPKLAEKPGVRPSPAAANAVREDMRPLRSSAPPRSPASTEKACDVAFFTGKPLSAAGLEAMNKVFAALRKIKADIEVCINEERRAKVIVLLGSDALAKRAPQIRPVRGKWIDFGGVPAVMTFSPDFIFTHFQDGSPRMNVAKREMWDDIKSALSRLHQKNDLRTTKV